MKIYINYSDKKNQSRQNFALLMAKRFGQFDKCIGYTREDIDDVFYQEHKEILDNPKGGGFWLWKPYFIHRTLESMSDGDYLLYSDAGAFFLKNVEILIKELEKSDQTIMGTELPLIEYQWTKKELFRNMNCNYEKFKYSNQLQASPQLIMKCDFSSQFYKEYLLFAFNQININDTYDKKIKQENGFIEHRHDQSIFSLLYKKYNLKPFKDPTQIGRYPRGYSASKEDNFKPGILYTLSNGRKFRYYNYIEMYDMVLFIHRKKNPILGFIKFKVKEMLYKFRLYKGLIR